MEFLHVVRFIISIQLEYFFFNFKDKKKSPKTLKKKKQISVLNYDGYIESISSGTLVIARAIGAKLK